MASGMTPDATASEEKGGRNYWAWLIWPVVVVIVYVLSTGPALFLSEKGVISDKLFIVYRPLYVVVEKTYLLRSLNIYLHLWAPNVYSSDGLLIRKD